MKIQVRNTESRGGYNTVINKYVEILKNVGFDIHIIKQDVNFSIAEIEISYISTLIDIMDLCEVGEIVLGTDGTTPYIEIYDGCRE